MTAAARYLPGFEAEQRSVALSQWYTPADLAERVWAWAAESQRRTVARVLEPSAGRGALVAPALKSLRVRRLTAIDIDAGNVDTLKRSFTGRKLAVVRGDFLSFTARDRFDLCIQNPPYEDDRDVAFIRHGLRFAPVVVGIYRSALVHGSNRFETLWKHVDMTRIAYLVNRPKFGEGTGAQSDFIVAEFMRRDISPARKRGEPSQLTQEWW